MEPTIPESEPRSAAPPLTPPPGGWAPPPLAAPRGPSLLLILVVFAVAASVVLAALLALIALQAPTNPPSTMPPFVQLGDVEIVEGNATFRVDVVAPLTRGAAFEGNLRVDSVDRTCSGEPCQSSNGTAAPIVEIPSFAIVIVSGHRYRIAWDDVGSRSVLDPGDRFIVAGDNQPLPPGLAYVFFLIWSTQSKVVDTTSWTTKPFVRFTAVSQSGGNATIAAAEALPPLGYPNYRVNLRVGTVSGTPVSMPPGGIVPTSVALEISGTTYRIYFVDLSGDGRLGPGDQFRVTGNDVALPAATSFTFYLIWAADGSVIESASWTTP